MSATPRSATADRKPYDLATAAHDYPEWHGPPSRTILVCAHPRSGSTLLGEALYFAGGFGCPLEYFHRGFRPAFDQRWGARGIDALVRALHRSRTDPDGVFGVKLFWRDLEEIAHELDPVRFSVSEAWAEDTALQRYRDIWNCVSPIFPDPVIISLGRHDRLRQAASAITAVQSGRWRAIPESGDVPAVGEVVYDHDRMLAQIALADFASGHWERFFEATGAKPYRLYYEDMDRDYDASVTSLLRHLGSEAAVPRQRMRRQSNANTERLVLQFLRDSQAR